MKVRGDPSLTTHTNITRSKPHSENFQVLRLILIFQAFLGICLGKKKAENGQHFQNIVKMKSFMVGEHFEICTSEIMQWKNPPP